MNDKLQPNKTGNVPFSQHANRNWIVISFLFLVLIAANTYVSRITVNDLIRLQTNISESGEVIETIQELFEGLLMAESGHRGYLLTKEETYLVHYQTAIEKIDKYSALALTLKSQVDEHTELIQKLVSNVKAKVKMFEATVTQAKSGEFAAAIKAAETYESRQIYTNINNLFASIKLNEDSQQNVYEAQLEKVTTQANTNGFISFITGLLLVVGLYFMARLNIRNQERHHENIRKQNIRLQHAVQERTEELSIFSDELKRSNRELEDFAFVASHDLQEPLRKIMAFGDRLSTSGDNLEEKQRSYLKRMRTAAARMSTLISDLLEFSRINTRGIPFQEVNLNQIVDSCVEDLSVLIEESQAQISYENLPTIQADPMQMRQLLFNLIANAIKFSKNQENSQIAISASSSKIDTSNDMTDFKDWITIRVTDNGIGFEQEYAEKIFAPFQRLHSRESFKGTGIGLAICRRIVERHNGTIVATGSPEEGATFEFSLPADNRIISALQISKNDNESICG